MLRLKNVDFLQKSMMKSIQCLPFTNPLISNTWIYKKIYLLVVSERGMYRAGILQAVSISPINANSLSMSLAFTDNPA